MLSLAIGGFSTALQVLSRFQSTVFLGVSRAQAERAAQVSLDRQFEGRGPFRSVGPEQFSGDEAGFQYACGRAEPCSVRLQNEGSGLRLLVDDGYRQPGPSRLREAGPARFKYAGRYLNFGRPEGGSAIHPLARMWLPADWRSKSSHNCRWARGLGE